MWFTSWRVYRACTRARGVGVAGSGYAPAGDVAADSSSMPAYRLQGACEKEQVSPQEVGCVQIHFIFQPDVLRILSLPSITEGCSRFSCPAAHRMSLGRC